MYDNIKTFNCFSFLGGAICFLFIEERYYFIFNGQKIGELLRMIVIVQAK